MKNNFRDAGLVVAVISLIISAVVMLIFVYNASLQTFCIFAPILCVTGGFTAAKLISVTRKNYQYFARIDSEIDRMERVSMNYMPISIAIVDAGSKFVWFNQDFSGKAGKCTVTIDQTSMIIGSIIGLLPVFENMNPLNASLTSAFSPDHSLMLG